MTPQAQEPAGAPGEWYERFGSIYTARTDGGEDWVCTFGAPREKPQLTQVEMANGKRIAAVPAMERDLARLRSVNAGLVAAMRDLLALDEEEYIDAPYQDKVRAAARAALAASAALTAANLEK